MKDYLLLKELQKEVQEGRVSASRMGDLTIFKYTQDCHIQGLWNYANRQARGLIVRDDATIVARPFPKFFNLNETTETQLDALPWNETVEVFEKMDGSCGIGYWSEDQLKWLLATPGSMESDQAVEGTRILNAGHYKLEYLPVGCTPVFEIIYPDNRIVVDYHGKAFLSLLAIIEHSGTEWHQSRVDQIATKCGFHRPRRFDINIRGEIPFEDNHEGYVVLFGNGLRLKVKSPAYLRIHRLLNHMSPKGVIDLIRGHEYRVTVQQLPDNIARDFDDIRAYVQGLYFELLHKVKDHHAALPSFATRKETALWIQANVPNELTGLIFALIDNKLIEDKLWRIVLEKVKDEKGNVPVFES